MDPDLSRRLRQYGDLVDDAADEAADHASVIQIGDRTPHWYTFIAAAAAAAAVVASLVIASAFGSSPSGTGVGEGGLVTVDSTEPATTSPPSASRLPATSSSSSTTSSTSPQPASVDHTEAQRTNQTEAPPTTRPGPCPDGYGGAEPGRPLRLCVRGELVRSVQQQLNALIGAGLNVDGEFGPSTEHAVRAFQAQHGLEVDGLVGPATMAALFAPPSTT